MKHVAYLNSNISYLDYYIAAYVMNYVIKVLFDIKHVSKLFFPRFFSLFFVYNFETTLIYYHEVFLEFADFFILTEGKEEEHLNDL